MVVSFCVCSRSFYRTHSEGWEVNETEGSLTLTLWARGGGAGGARVGLGGGAPDAFPQAAELTAHSHFLLPFPLQALTEMDLSTAFLLLPQLGLPEHCIHLDLSSNHQYYIIFMI